MDLGYGKVGLLYVKLDRDALPLSAVRNPNNHFKIMIT